MNASYVDGGWNIAGNRGMKRRQEARKGRHPSAEEKKFHQSRRERSERREDSSKAGPMNHDVFPMPGAAFRPSVERLYVYTGEQGCEIFLAGEAPPF